MPPEPAASTIHAGTAIDTGKAYPLLRAEWLLTPQAPEKPRRGHIWLAAFAFAASGLSLGFIMLLGIGYDSRGHEATKISRIPTGEVETQIVDHLDSSGVMEAVPLKDEEGQPLTAPTQPQP